MPGNRKKANCLCRHGEHEGTQCFWESPGGDLIGQACNCDKYRPCPHPENKKGYNSLRLPYCGNCAQHFPSEEAYTEAKKARINPNDSSTWPKGWVPGWGFNVPSKWSLKTYLLQRAVGFMADGLAGPATHRRFCSKAAENIEIETNPDGTCPFCGLLLHSSKSK